MTDDVTARGWEWYLARLHYFGCDTRYGQACDDNCRQMRDVVSTALRKVEAERDEVQTAAHVFEENWRRNLQESEQMVSEHAALTARVAALEKSNRRLLAALPDSIHEDDESWGWAWHELSGEAQDSVKAARESARAASPTGGRDE